MRAEWNNKGLHATLYVLDDDDEDELLIGILAPAGQGEHDRDRAIAPYVAGGRAALYIPYLDVPRARRGRGLGAAAVRLALQVTAKRGADRVYLYANAQRGHVRDLARFYERLGFQPLGPRDLAQGGVPMGWYARTR